MRHFIRLLALLIASPIAAQPTLSSGIPITVNAPATVSGVHSWPVTAGIPFPQGLISGVSGLTIVDDTNRAVPCQIDTVTTWRADQQRAIRGITALLSGARCRRGYHRANASRSSWPEILAANKR